MATSAARVSREARLTLADGLTASRVVVALALLGSPADAAAVLLLAWAWVSDAVDGPLARSTGRSGRLAWLDHPADAGVGVALAWYLGGVGFWPQAPAVAAAVLLVALWTLTRVFAVQMLLLALVYGGFLWWAAEHRPWGWAVLPAIALAALAAEWKRLTTELIPDFLRAWRNPFA